jgi:hypothetical protein
MIAIINNSKCRSAGDYFNILISHQPTNLHLTCGDQIPCNISSIRIMAITALDHGATQSINDNIPHGTEYFEPYHTMSSGIYNISSIDTLALHYNYLPFTLKYMHHLYYIPCNVMDYMPLNMHYPAHCYCTTICRNYNDLKKIKHIAPYRYPPPAP